MRLLLFGNRLLLGISERERDWRAFFNFWCCEEIWFGLNRTSHPDWVKVFGDSNSQIKLSAKQKFQFSFYYIISNMEEKNLNESISYLIKEKENADNEDMDSYRLYGNQT